VEWRRCGGNSNVSATGNEVTAISGFNNPIISGGGSLVYPSIHSPAYEPGVQGWTINADGSAEFNDLAVRGSFNGLDYVINSAGIFFYSSEV
jgi:hypothetical protein